MILPTAFDANLYAEFRPEYPAELFTSVQRALRIGPADPFAVLDVGCGTGLTLAPWMAFENARPLVGLDRDPQMLARAREIFPRADWQLGDAGRLPFDEQTFHIISVGSAFHWFDREKFATEAARVLTSTGALFILEYQFPHALENPGLNDWARKKFNREWRAPGQTPRGSLRSLTGFLRNNPVWRELHLPVPKMIRELNSDDYFGQLVSQSRYLHSETSLTSGEAMTQRRNLRAEISEIFAATEPAVFDFRLSAFLFCRREAPNL